MAPLLISFLIRSVYSFCLPKQIWYGGDPGLHLSAMPRHVLTSCKIALSWGRYIWKYNKSFRNWPQSKAWLKERLPSLKPIHNRERGAKSWHGELVGTTNHGKCLLDCCDDCWDVSSDLPECDSHPNQINKTKADIMIHSGSTQQVIMMKLIIPYENRMEEANIYKREKYLNLTEELEDASYKAVVMPVEVGARGFKGSSDYNILIKLSISGSKRTKALKLLAEIAQNSSQWIRSRRNERFLRKD